MATPNRKPQSGSLLLPPWHRAGWRRVGCWGVEGKEGNRHHPAPQMGSLDIVQGKLAACLVKTKS